MATAEYIRQQFVRPVDLGVVDSSQEEFLAKVTAVLRRTAIDNGAQIDGEPELETSEPGASVVGPQGALIATVQETYRIPVTPPPAVQPVTVHATESEPGVWVAEIPAAPIVAVTHGLGTYGVDVDAFDVYGQTTGYRGFIPVTLNEVEFLRGDRVHAVRIAVPKDEETDADPAIP